MSTSRVMALDVGDRRIGVAVSDPTRLLARSVKVIRRAGGEADLAEIRDLIRAYEVGELVIGYPRHLSGDAGEQARRVEAYVAALCAYLAAHGVSVAVSYWDERYSSVVASEIVQETRRKRRRPQHVDAVAAAVILQEYLDAHAAERQRHQPSGAGEDQGLPEGR